MRILHTADLHLGQVIYQHYEREDEHRTFFSQLEGWLREYRPDAVVVSGDIFDVAQPSAAVWKEFTGQFTRLRRLFPEIAIVAVAGNHDSPSRVQSHSEVWDLAGVTLVGTPPPPSLEENEGWEERYVVEIPNKGYIIALPFMQGERQEVFDALLRYVEGRNSGSLPVVMTGHLAVSGMDPEGHDVGMLRMVGIEKLGSGYDYLALGHIHKPQTLGGVPDRAGERREYAAPVARYSGSALHVSGDEAYPHSVSLVEIDSHGGNVAVTPLRIEQLRHFVTLPGSGKEPFATPKEALKGVKKFIEKNDGCYLRLKVLDNILFPADFTTQVYAMIEESGKDIRYNPRMLRVAPAQEEDEAPDKEGEREIEVGELQQMENPFEFVRGIIDRYPMSVEEMEEAFREIEEEVRRAGETK